MKHEWKKSEKSIYLPKNKPEIIEVPEYKFFSIKGEGNPNSESFSDFIEVLYSLSYGVRMSYKKGMEPEGFYEYTVYPLEGIWDLTEEGRKNYNGVINKNELAFNLMIRQPDFVNEDFANKIIEYTRIKKPHPLLDLVKFESITDGVSIQMLHKGSYDSEPESFSRMEEFAHVNSYRRRFKTHREIYLSDARKVEPDNLKTVLRFQVESV